MLDQPFQFGTEKLNINHFISCLMFLSSFILFQTLIFFCNKSTLPRNVALLKGLEMFRLARAHCIYPGIIYRSYIKLHLRRFFFYHKHFYANKYMIKRMQLTPRPETESSCNILFSYFPYISPLSLKHASLPQSFGHFECNTNPVTM